MLRVGSAQELEAAVLAFKAADKTLRNDINKATRETMNPVWRSLVSERAGNVRGIGSRVLNVGVRIQAGNPPAARAAWSNRGIGDGKRIVPSRDWRGWEFGSDSNAYSQYERTSPKGKRHTVERRTMRHMPPRRRTGNVVYPAFAEIAPRMVSLWVQLIMKKYYDAAEGS